MQEIWKEIPLYKGRYYISSIGRVKSIYLNKEIIRKNGKHKRGYELINLWEQGKGKGFLVHRLVAQEFILNPDNKLEVNHINGIKNDNRVENLEWCTASENILHKFHSLGYKSNFHTNPPSKGKLGANNKDSKSVIQYSLEGEFIKTWGGMAEVTRSIGINQRNISSCCSGLRKNAGGFIWKYNK